MKILNYSVDVVHLLSFLISLNSEKPTYDCGNPDPVFGQG